MNPVSYIPDNAPFNPAQRAWLNGFLAGLWSQAPAEAAPATATRDVAVLFGSQTGTGERLAKKIAKELKQKAIPPASPRWKATPRPRLPPKSAP